MTTEKQKQAEDCYFFFYGTCAKGDGCAFRHELNALGNEIICKRWLKGSCTVQNCSFRHTKPTKKKRSKTPCYFENQPSGCRKPHCAFLHSKDRKELLEHMKTSPHDALLPIATSESLSAKKEKDDLISATKQFVSYIAHKNKDDPGFKKSTIADKLKTPSGQPKLEKDVTSRTSRPAQQNPTVGSKQMVLGQK